MIYDRFRERGTWATFGELDRLCADSVLMKLLSVDAERKRTGSANARPAAVMSTGGSPLSSRLAISGPMA
jgi:hypothetical protein